MYKISLDITCGCGSPIYNWKDVWCHFGQQTLIRAIRNILLISFNFTIYQ
jgi:hypothetical protein